MTAVVRVEMMRTSADTLRADGADSLAEAVEAGATALEEVERLRAEAQRVAKESFGWQRENQKKHDKWLRTREERNQLLADVQVLKIEVKRLQSNLDGEYAATTRLDKMIVAVEKERDQLRARVEVLETGIKEAANLELEVYLGECSCLTRPGEKCRACTAVILAFERIRAALNGETIDMPKLKERIEDATKRAALAGDGREG